MEWSGVQNTFRKLAANAKSAADDTASVLKASAADAAETWKDIADVTGLSTAAREAQKGIDKTAAWLVGDDGAQLPSQPSPHDRHLPTWKPPAPPSAPQGPPRLEELRKGDDVFRKAEPAVVVKVDYEVEPPSLVVRMVNDGREVGTTGTHVTLGLKISGQCLRSGLPVCVVGLQQKPQLNGLRGVLAEFKADLNRWNVVLRYVPEDSATDSIVSVRPCNISALLSGHEEHSVASTSAGSTAESVCSADQVDASEDCESSLEQAECSSGYVYHTQSRDCKASESSSTSIASADMSGMYVATPAGDVEETLAQPAEGTEASACHDETNT